MSKVVMFRCDKCGKEGKPPFTEHVVFDYGSHWDGQETSRDFINTDLCAVCAGDVIVSLVKIVGEDRMSKFISESKWLSGRIGKGREA